METMNELDEKEFQFIDEGDLRKYRTEIPNMVDEVGLSVYAFRLYFHIKRVAGARNGKCWESIRTMAEKCNMSKSSASEAKEELIQAGLISVEKGDYTKQKPDTIRIVDIWQENFKKFSEKTCPPNGQAVRLMDTSCPPNGQAVRHTVTKKEPYKKEPLLLPPQTPPSIVDETEEKSGGGGGEQLPIQERDDDYAKLAKAYMDEGFGFLTEFSKEQLEELLKEYPIQWILDAMKVAVSANKRQIRYAGGILKKWKAEGRKDTPATLVPAQPVPDASGDLWGVDMKGRRVKLCKKDPTLHYDPDPQTPYNLLDSRGVFKEMDFEVYEAWSKEQDEKWREVDERDKRQFAYNVSTTARKG